MSRITFIYHHNSYKMIIKENNSINHILNEYASLLNENINDFLFLYKGKNLILGQNSINLTKNVNVIIMVFKRKKYNNGINDIICPDCKNLAFLNIKDDKNIEIDCHYHHKHAYSSMNEFMNTQIIDETRYKCGKCQNNKNLYKDKNFYICSCGKFICQLCFKNHFEIESHKLIEL